MVEFVVTVGASRRVLLMLFGLVVVSMKLVTDVYIHNRQLAFSDPYRDNFVPTERSELARIRYSQTKQALSRLRGESGGNNVIATSGQTTEVRQGHPIVPIKSDYAYAFVIGGCNPNKPTYKGFLYNILVTTRLLRDQGSTADVVAFFQLSYHYKDADVLPEEDRRVLESLNIKTLYIPKSEHESFYETVMNKFKILTLTQYRRVLLMDGDVMPVNNLDYVFELTDDNKFGPGNSTLKGNVVVSGPWEPSNAGFFLLSPGEGEYERLSDIIHKRQEKAKDMEGVKFDEVNGWGHAIAEGDEWVSRKDRGRNWTFHFAFSDQGLLWHWTKYVKQEVSVIYKERVENWSKRGKITALEQTLSRPFKGLAKPLVYQFSACRKFMCDYLHFSGSQKPWLHPPPEDLSETTRLQDGTHLWWYYLQKIDIELGMGLDFVNWKVGRPSLGLYASWRDMDKHIEKTTGVKV